ncbi:MAG: arginine--tRNA ligase [Patescibacteria group bacterium]
MVYFLFNGEDSLYTIAMNFKDQLHRKILKTVYALWPQVRESSFSFGVDYPPGHKFGDYTTNAAMKLAGIVHQSPMTIAESITVAMGKTIGVRESSVVAPGFINIFLDEKWLSTQVEEIVSKKTLFGRSDLGEKKRIVVEFVSANPTGPLTLGNGRAAFGGDALCNILQLAGYRPYREYYINDIGNQVNILAESVLRRYWQHQGINMEFPDYCYQGAYVEELAKNLYLPNYKLASAQKLEVVRDKIKGRILAKMISGIKKVLVKKVGVRYDKWFSEKSLYASGLVDKMLALLKEKKLLYKSEGAIWLKTTQYGDDKDRVLIKADGDPVYFLSDIALRYHRFFKRKFSKEIFILGADHHGYQGRMQAAMSILGQAGKLDILLIQLVRLLKHGQEVRMSKRSGTFVTLEELVDEVGVDAARYFFLMYDFNTHMDFNLDLAKKKSKDNPVYYVQYAHARICSIMRKLSQFTAANKGKKPHRNAAKVLEPAEIGLIKQLIKWPELVADIARSYQVHKLTSYATTVATEFHTFYTQCRVINGKEVNYDRVMLVRATRQVLQNVFAAMGVSAPEKM